MSECIKEYHLKQETPILHFQYDQKGATLRGSDVKPRLDKFLIRQIEAENKKNQGNAEKKIDWKKFRISDDHDALNYQIQIRAVGEHENINYQEKYKAYFGNMFDKSVLKEYEQNFGVNEDEAKRKLSKFGVFYPDGIIVRIICFNNDLMEEIEKHIRAFFILNNFGTRQDKGFGSFTIDDTEGDFAKQIMSTYMASEGFYPYQIETKGCSDDNLLDNLSVLYQFIKSGINFGSTYKKSILTEYMLTKNIAGEKRALKESKVAPKVKKDKRDGKKVFVEDEKPPKAVTEEHYIRAILGVSGNQTWNTSIVQKKEGTVQVDKRGNPKFKKHTIMIEEKNGLIARYQSSLKIKIINGMAYFLFYEPNKIIYHQKFTFKNSNTDKTKDITTLDSFDPKDFMTFCGKELKNCSFTLGDNIYQFSITELGGNKDNG